MKTTKSESLNLMKFSEECELPDGWILTRLSEGLITDIQPGFACGKNTRDRQGIPHLRPMNISEKGEINLNDLKFVPESECTKSEKFVQTGDVLFNNTNSPELVGKTAYYNLQERRAFSNHMTRLRCNTDRLDPKFCALFIHQKWREGYFKTVCNNHVSQSSVSRNVLLETPFILPPLPEQHRIVARVEALLSQVNAARDRLNRVPLIMKRFRQAVLAAACSGRLTEEFEGYALQPAGNLFTDARYGTSNKCDYEEKGRVPVIRIPNISTGKIDISNLKYGALSEKEVDRLVLKEGDIVICRTNGSLDLVGKAAIIPNLPRGFVFASYLIRVRVNRDLLTPEYFHIILSSKFGRDHFEEQARSTAGQFNINLEILRTMNIPLPPLLEQHEIVLRVNALFALADQIEHEVKEATKRTDALTQAVLAKAFRGELDDKK